MKPGQHVSALLYRPLLGLLLSLVAGSTLLAWSLALHRDRLAENRQQQAELLRLQSRRDALQAARPDIEAAARLLDSLPKVQADSPPTSENHPQWQIASREYRREFRHEPALLSQISDWQNTPPALNVVHNCHIRRAQAHLEARCAIAELKLLTHSSP